jgi:predicted phage terminase large subunit-like protein
VSESLIQRAVKRVGAERLWGSLTPQQQLALLSHWPAWGRPEQLPPPGDWRVWLVLAGRGFGKSRLGAEFVRSLAMKHPGCHIGMVARTAGEVRSVMVKALQTAWKGGVLDPRSIPHHQPSSRLLEWPNGSHATTYSADEPRQILGQNFDFFWADELAAWPSTESGRKETGKQRTVMEEVWHEGLMFALRGSGVAIPRTMGVVTTTPRPKKLIRELIKNHDTIVTRGSTYDNTANLSDDYIATIKRDYEGTRIGRQEIHAEVLDDLLGALWTRASIDDNRARGTLPDMVRVVIGVDPSGKSEGGDEQGIVVVGRGTDGHAYVLADRTTQDTPDGWGRRVVQAYEEFKADRIVVETNFGGQMAIANIANAANHRGYQWPIDGETGPVRAVTASRGKVVRAEPIAAMYEQGRVHHVGEHEKLEEQMREYVPDDGVSPDRMDALVWALTDLMVRGPTAWERAADLYD